MLQPTTKLLTATHLGVLVLGLAVGYQIPQLVDTYKLNEDVRQIERQITKSPDDPTDWFSLGATRHWAGDQEGALEAYARALELDPKNLQTFRQMGSLHLESGDHVTAEKWFQDALELAEKHFPDEVYESEWFLEYARRKSGHHGNTTMPSLGPPTRSRGSSAGSHSRTDHY